MQILRQLQEKEQLKRKTPPLFVPFLKERDPLGKLAGNHKRNTSIRTLKKRLTNKQSVSTTQNTKQKICFLKDVYSLNQNTVWANLTNISRLEKKFNLKVETEFVEQKPLTLFNQKLQLNDGTVPHRVQTLLSNSPKLGKNVSLNNVPPPVGYYYPKDVFNKKQPMLVQMKLQQETHRLSCKQMKTECSQTTHIPRLELSNQKTQNKIPQELLDRAYKTERMSTQHRFRYTPLHFDNEEFEISEHKMNQLRQLYKDLKGSGI